MRISMSGWLSLLKPLFSAVIHRRQRQSRKNVETAVGSLRLDLDSTRAICGGNFRSGTEAPLGSVTVP